MALYLIDIGTADKTKQIVGAVVNGTRFNIAMAPNWTVADLITRVNAVVPAPLTINSNVGDVLNTTDISEFKLVSQLSQVVDDFEGYGEDVPHPNVTNLNYVSFAGPTSAGSGAGALHEGDYRVGSAYTESGSDVVAGHGGSQGRYWLVSKGWTDDNGIAHDNHLAGDGHTDATGNPAGKYLAVDSSVGEEIYFSKTYAGLPAGDHSFTFSLCAACIGPSYSERNVPCAVSPNFKILVYAADGTTLLSEHETGDMVNDGVWKQYNLPFQLLAAQDIVIKVQNNIPLGTETTGNDFLVDQMGVARETITTFAGSTANAVDDNLGNINVGVAIPRNISTNDSACSVGTTTWVLNGVAANGLITGTIPNLVITATGPGAGSQDYDILCDGVIVDSAQIRWNGLAALAIAVDDAIGNVVPGVATPIDVSANDTSCSNGATTYALTGAATNGVVTGTAPNLVVTAAAVGAGSQAYNILCNGVISGTAAITWTGVEGAEAVNDNMGIIVTGIRTQVDVASNDTRCTSGITTWALIPGSEVNTTVFDMGGGSFDVQPTAAGAGSFQYNLLCDGVVFGTATVGCTGAAVAANAVDDTMGELTIGESTTINVLSNDTACSAGATTTALVAGSQVGATINTLGSGDFAVSPTAAGAGSFSYNLLCDGVITDTATVSWTAKYSANAEDDVAPGGVVGLDSQIDVSTNDTPCGGTSVTTYALVAGSENNAIVTPVAGSIFDYRSITRGQSSFQYNLLCDGVITDTGTVSWSSGDAGAGQVCVQLVDPRTEEVMAERCLLSVDGSINIPFHFAVDGLQANVAYKIVHVQTTTTGVLKKTEVKDVQVVTTSRAC